MMDPGVDRITMPSVLAFLTGSTRAFYLTACSLSVTMLSNGIDVSVGQASYIPPPFQFEFLAYKRM
jgi:hypothetical protein